MYCKLMVDFPKNEDWTPQAREPSDEGKARKPKVNKAETPATVPSVAYHQRIMHRVPE
jgi:hypothetical protein